MSSLLQHAKSELRRAGLFDPDADFDGEVAVQVVALMETLVAYGHSGGSLRLTLDFFNRVANHKPITPLTGEENEWDDLPVEMSEPVWQQNNRCLTIFRDKDHAWDSANGDKTITFPYTVE